jgi:hypothetical protein
MGDHAIFRVLRFGFSPSSPFFAFSKAATAREAMKIRTASCHQKKTNNTSHPPLELSNFAPSKLPTCHRNAVGIPNLKPINSLLASTINTFSIGRYEEENKGKE